MPHVLADERRVVLAYLTHESTPIWEMSKEQLAAKQDFREEIALLRFNPCFAHMFGAPNDEAFAGHPLAKRGLAPYGAFRIENSSWIRRLERMNSVHPRHQPDRFSKRQHLIFTFHDSTFECVCDGFEILEARGSILSVLPKMVQFLQGDASSG